LPVFPYITFPYNNTFVTSFPILLNYVIRILAVMPVIAPNFKQLIAVCKNEVGTLTAIADLYPKTSITCVGKLRKII